MLLVNRAAEERTTDCPDATTGENDSDKSRYSKVWKWWKKQEEEKQL